METGDFGRPAFRVASALCFPRLAGSPGERAARDKVARAFRDAGLETDLEFFYCSDYAITVAARWAMVPTGFILVAAALAGRLGFWAPAMILALLSLLPAAYVLKRVGEGFNDPDRPRQYRSANVVGRMAGKDGAGTVVLMAHYDSKSQVFPIWLRISIFLLSAAGSAALILAVAVCSLLEALKTPCLLTPIILPSALILLMADLSLLFNAVGNKSEGALDNATGVGIITEIATRLAKEKPEELNVVAAATAAEEIGLCGANAFIEAHAHELDPSSTLFLNFDGCGGDRVLRVLKSHGAPARKIPPDLARAIKEIADREGIQVKWTTIPAGMATDLFPVKKAGYKGVDFIGMAAGSHTRGDRIELVKESSLAEYVKVGMELAVKAGTRRT